SAVPGSELEDPRAAREPNAPAVDAIDDLLDPRYGAALQVCDHACGVHRGAIRQLDIDHRRHVGKMTEQTQPAHRALSTMSAQRRPFIGDGRVEAISVERDGTFTRLTAGRAGRTARRGAPVTGGALVMRGTLVAQGTLAAVCVLLGALLLAPTALAAGPAT